MKNLLSVAKTAVICFLIYKSLFYSFLFLVSGMWIITVLLLILFGYLCSSLFKEAIRLNQFYKSFKQYKSYKHFAWREKLPRVEVRTEISKRYSSETA
jgi:hypothetical protein